MSTAAHAAVEYRSIAEYIYQLLTLRTSTHAHSLSTQCDKAMKCINWPGVKPLIRSVSPFICRSFAQSCSATIRSFKRSRLLKHFHHCTRSTNFYRRRQATDGQHQQQQHMCVWQHTTQHAISTSEHAERRWLKNNGGFVYLINARPRA